MCSAPSFLPPQVDPHDVEGAGRCNALLTNAGVACIHTRLTYIVCKCIHVHPRLAHLAYARSHVHMHTYRRPKSVCQAITEGHMPSNHWCTGSSGFQSVASSVYFVRAWVPLEQGLTTRSENGVQPAGIWCTTYLSRHRSWHPPPCLLNPMPCCFTSSSNDATLSPGPAHPTPFTHCRCRQETVPRMQLPAPHSALNIKHHWQHSASHQACTPFHQTALYCA